MRQAFPISRRIRNLSVRPLLSEPVPGTGHVVMHSESVVLYTEIGGILVQVGLYRTMSFSVRRIET